MDLSDAVRAYLRDRANRGYAKGTVYNDKRILTLFLADVGNINTARLRPQHLDTFWAHRHWAPGTTNKARATLSGFFKWCQHRGYLPRTMNLLDDTRALRVPVRKRIIIPQGEFSTFIEAGYKDPRTRIVLALGLYLFTRISETGGLRWQDWNESDGTIEVYRDKTKTLDTLPVCSELDRELKLWRRRYAVLVGETPHPSWFIVPNRSRPKFTGTAKSQLKQTGGGEYLPTTRMRPDGVIKLALKQADYYQDREGGHTLRRSGAIALYNQLTSVGHDRAIRVCQAMLGHSAISTTEIYLRLDLDRKVRNDLLAGQFMFPEGNEATILNLGDRLHGESNA